MDVMGTRASEGANENQGAHVEHYVHYMLYSTHSLNAILYRPGLEEVLD